MRVGSLFSGIGGFDLGLERAGMRIEWQVENNEFCREVLKKHWPKVPCHYDIKAIDWRDIPRVDLICGGFPCQPFSLAGKRRGQADDRYLWPEVVRCLDALRPRWFVGENVPGIINLALDEVCADLESLGYTVWTVCLPACAVDAPHIRQRVWVVAHCDRGDWWGRTAAGRVQEVAMAGSAAAGATVADAARELPHWGGARSAGREEYTDGCGDVSHTEREGPQGLGAKCGLREVGEEVETGRSSRWLPEPELGRSSDGLPCWLDGHIGKGMSYAESQRAIKTLRALWKPDVAKAIWRAAGGLDRILQAEVLFALVREYKKDAHQARLLMASQEALTAFVRGVWRTATTSRPSRRSNQIEQRSVEHSDALQVVSQLPPCDSETPWPALGWEDGIARVASGVEHRVDRLRGLGNAIVPQVVEALGQMIIKVSA